MPWPRDTPRFEDRFTRLQTAVADRYRLERELDGMGHVTAYLARDLAADRPVTLRLIDPARTHDAGAARLLRSLRSAGRIEHRHLLPLLDAGVLDTDEGEAVYFASPFLAGETLRSRLDRDIQLPVLEALAVAQDVAAALAAAHAQGVTHGGVAAESIMLAGGQALLADLGVAAALQDPEPTAQQDVQALGRVLYEMLAGAPMPEGDVPLIRAGRAGVPEEAELVVARMVAPAPDGFRTAEEVLAGLEAAGAAARAISLPGTTTIERLALRQPIPARWTVFTFAVLGLLGLSLWLRYSAPELVPQAPRPARPRSVAVLPFLTTTPDTVDHYLGDGLSQELTARLGRVNGLRVAGAGSVARFDPARTDARRVGQRLGVDAVLLGTARPFEGRLRVRAHLLSVREGFDLWSETYERAAGEIGAMEREIVRAVTGALRFQAPLDSAPPPPPPAHAAYLRGLGAAARGRPGAAAALFQEAVQLDSTFAPAWAALAGAWLEAGADDGVRPADAAARARGAAERALALDTLSAAAHAAVGGVRLLYDWDWPAAEAALRRSLELNPNLAETHILLAHLLLATGRADEATEAGRQAVGLSPLDPSLRLELARHWLYLGDYVRAGEEVERSAALAPGERRAELLRGIVAAATGRYEAALGPLERAAGDSDRADEARAMLGWVHALAGRREEGREVQASLLRTAAARYVSPYLLAFLAEALGDRRAAFAALDRAVAARAPELVDLRIDARMDRLRADRRFGALARRIGLP